MTDDLTTQSGGTDKERRRPRRRHGRIGNDDLDQLLQLALLGAPSARSEYFRYVAPTAPLATTLKWLTGDGTVNKAIQHTGCIDRHSLALDLVTDGYYKALDSYDASQGTQFTTWWITQIKYGVLDLRRTLSRRHSSIEIDEEAKFEDPEANATIEAIPLKLDLRDILDVLESEAPDQATALWLRSQLGRRGGRREAAEELELTEAEIINLIRRAKRRFKALWRGHGHDQEAG